MQIASQVYGIETGANGLCFFKTGEPAYIIKRFDVGVSSVKLRKEDFSSLPGLMPAYDLLNTHLHVDLTQFTTQYPLTEQLTEASFLQLDTKKTYLAEYRQRRNRLKDMK